MGQNAGPNRTTAIEDHHKEEAYEHCGDDLHQILFKAHAAAVDEIQNMTQPEGDTGDRDRPFDTVAAHGFKEKTAEDQFLQKAHAQHLQNKANRSDSSVVQFHTAPDIKDRDDKKGQVI